MCFRSSLLSTRKVRWREVTTENASAFAGCKTKGLDLGLESGWKRRRLGRDAKNTCVCQAHAFRAMSRRRLSKTDFEKKKKKNPTVSQTKNEIKCFLSYKLRFWTLDFRFPFPYTPLGFPWSRFLVSVFNVFLKPEPTSRFWSLHCSLHQRIPLGSQTTCVIWAFVQVPSS